MSLSSTESQVLISQAVSLFPRDTVLTALRVMQRYGLTRLPVVDEQHGELLGHVSEEELYRVWAGAPLARMSELLNVRASAFEPDAFRPPRGRTWLH
ncbi:CBS domain-containing protein [Aggregicoccus sp. 17bor-14]|uniref:CBS domain-containing protein n=1 Tax=Myxococcaceae TaxID=31 RepID=UPI003519FA61